MDTLCSALERNKGGLVMKALKDRGVGETTLLGQWWCKGLFLGGKASLYQSHNEQAVTFLKKGSKVSTPINGVDRLGRGVFIMHCLFSGKRQTLGGDAFSPYRVLG